MELASMGLLNEFVDLCNGFMSSAVVEAAPNNLLEEFTNCLLSILKAFHNDSFITRRFKIVDLVNVIFALVSDHHCRVVYIRTENIHVVSCCDSLHKNSDLTAYQIQTWSTPLSF